MENKFTSIINEIIDKLNDSKSDEIIFVQRSKYRQKVWRAIDVIQVINILLAFNEDQRLSKGDTVIICGPNSPVWASVFLACLIQKIVVVPLDYNSSDEFLNNTVKKINPALLYISKYKEFHLNSNINTHYLENIEQLIERKKQRSMSKVQQPILNEKTVLEIIFTSGSSGHPKGTIITHENITANIHNLLEPMRVKKKIKLLSIIPLSHMFEQSVGFFTPLKLGLPIVYPFMITPIEIMRAIKENQITSIVCVPAFLKLLKDGLERELIQQNKSLQFRLLLSMSKYFPFNIRRRLFCKIHANLGGQLHEFFVGGAPLDRIVEDFWILLGVKVTQGYGLTECSSIVTINAGNFYKKYSVGRSLPNQEIKILPDGEIIVKGKNVVSGYYNEPQLTKEAFENQWLHTGDIGELDSDGNLFIKGRKKNIIVNTAGMKVYPEDIESKLNQSPDIKDSVVLGLEKNSTIIITAVIIPKDKRAKLREIIEQVNSTLASHQKIQDFVIWKDSDFPRTATKKVIRNQISERLQIKYNKLHDTVKEKSSANILIKILSDLSNIPIDQILPHSNLILDLKLDSIKKLELVSRIQEEIGGYIDEQSINQYVTVRELEKNIDKSSGNRNEIMISKWQLNVITKCVRQVLQSCLFLLLEIFQRLEISQKLSASERYPVIFIANHTSHLDTPTILKTLPKPLRALTSVAAAKDYFFTNPFLSFFVRLLFNAFPLDREKNITQTMITVGKLLDYGYSPEFPN